MSSGRLRGRPVAAVGVGFSKVERRSVRPLGALAIEACTRAIDDAGLRVDDIDGLSNYPNASRMGAGDVDGVDIVGVNFVAQAFGLENLRWSTSITQGTITASAVEAVYAVAAGACDYALVWRGMHNPANFGEPNMRSSGDRPEFNFPYGDVHNVMRFAFPYARYLAKYGASRQDMAVLIERIRRDASANEDAVFFGQAITQQDYLDSKMIAEPLSRLDCDMPVDGCAAVVFTTAERARDLRHKPAYVRGGVSLGLNYTTSPAFLLEDFQAGAARVARAIWESCGLTARDIDQANIYDGFSYFLYLYLEALGFCGEGEAAAILAGRGGAHDIPPFNTNGGALGMGRLHGSPQVIEAILQVQGRARAQVRGAQVTLAQTGGPITGAGALVFASEPPSIGV